MAFIGGIDMLEERTFDSKKNAQCFQENLGEFDFSTNCSGAHLVKRPRFGFVSRVDYGLYDSLVPA